MNLPATAGARRDPEDEELNYESIRSAVSRLAAVYVPRTFGGIPDATIEAYAAGLRRFDQEHVTRALADLSLRAEAFPSLAQIVESINVAARRSSDTREYLSPEAAVARAEAELRERARKAREATPKLAAPTEDPMTQARRGVRALVDLGDDPPLDPDWRERVRKAMTAPEIGPE